MWCVFKNCSMLKYPSQLWKFSPKSCFLFSEFLCQEEGGVLYDYILKWNNSFNHNNLYNPSYNQITLFLVIYMFPGKISYSIFLESCIGNNNNKKSMKWGSNWLMKLQCFSLVDNSSLSLYLMACKIG